MSRRAVALFLVAAIASACSSRAKVPTGKESKPLPSRFQDADGGMRKQDDGEPPSVPSRTVAVIGSKAIGPFYARGSGGAAIAAWIGVGEDGARKLAALSVGANATAKTDSWVLANVPNETTALIVRAAGDRSGFFAAWSALLDRGEVLAVISVGADGAAKGPVVDIARTNDHVVWLEVVPTPRGAVCVWAEETREGEANIQAVALDAIGKPRGLPTRIAHGASGWQAIAAGDGVGVAVVSQPEQAKGKPAAKVKAKGGVLNWIRLDGDGRTMGSPTPIATTPTVTGDVDVVAAGDAFVFAWTDRTGEDPEVTLAIVDGAGKLQAPRRAMESIGGGSLAGLVAGKAGIVLAWDESTRRVRPSRRVHLSKVTPGGSPAAQEIGAVEVQGRGAPELVATDAGFAMLFPASVCVSASASSAPNAPPCASSGIAPTFVRFDAQGIAGETQPIRLGDRHDAAAVAWSLDCAGDKCAALAATSETPTPVSLVDLAPRATPFRAPIVASLPASAPRVTVLKTLAAGEPFADLAVVRVGEGALLATITTASEDDEEKTEKKKKPGAVVAVREIDANGDAKGPPFVVTSRARTLGGVAIAASGTPEDGAALVWTAKDGTSTQVHVTKLNAKGKRTNEVQLTSSKGGVADVTIAWAGGGWLVAWVDARDGNGEVYAARLDKDLNRTSKEERITNAPGDASDVALLVQGDRAYVAWADPRDSTKDGFADIWLAPLRTKDATRAGDELKILGTAAHSRTPSLALAGDVPVLAWIEEAPMGLDTSNMGSFGAMVARLDSRGRPQREPVRISLAGEGLATAIALEATRTGVRAYVSRASRAELGIDAMDLGTDASPAYSVLAVEGPPSIDIALAPLTGWLFYDDESGEPGERRLRRATVLWRR